MSGTGGTPRATACPGLSPGGVALGLVEAGWFTTVLWLAVVDHLGTPRPTWRAEYWVMAALALLCAVVTFARRSRPPIVATLAVAVIGLGVLVVLVRPLGSLGPLRLIVSAALAPVLLAAVVRRADRRSAVVVVLLAAVAGVLDVERGGNSATADITSRWVNSQPSVPFMAVTATLLIVLPVAVGTVLRHRDGIERARSLAVLRAEERLQVARELHDSVANHVTGIIVAAQAAGLALNTSPGTRSALEEIESTGNRALGAMARMVGALRSPGTDSTVIGVELPFAVASPLAAVRAAIGHDPSVTLRLDGTTVGDDGADAAAAGDMAADVTATLHRITVEALTNARRYRTAGGRIDVDLRTPHAARLVLEVTNPISPTSTTSRGSGFGLIGLQERAAAVGGQLDAGPHGPLWRLRTELPR